ARRVRSRRDAVRRWRRAAHGAGRSGRRRNGRRDAGHDAGARPMSARASRRSRSSGRGLTLLEVMVSRAIPAMIALLIYGAFDSMARGKKGEAMRSERAREGREAVLRMTRELTTAFLSMHNPANTALVTRNTAFIAQSSATYDRIDFAAFAHRRVEKDAKESDQCEVGYFV